MSKSMPKIAMLVVAVIAFAACAADSKPSPGTSGNAVPSASSSTSASSSASSAPAAPSAALDVTAAEPAPNTYVFDTAGVESVPAGLVAVTFSNSGTMVHEMRLVKIRDGNFAAYRGTVASPADGSNASAVADEVANAPSTDPGRSNTFNADVSPGTYALVCLLSAPDGTAFAQHGMVRELTVTPA